MSEQGPPAPLPARSLALATLVAGAIAALALVGYILPANYGVDPVGAGAAFGLDGQPPGEARAQATPEAPNVTLDEAPLRTYTATWPTTTAAGPGADGYTPENETTTVDLALATVNVTEARFTLTWTDDNATAGQDSQPDELELVIEAPDGTRTEPARAEGTSEGEAEIEITVPLPGPPDDRTVHAADADQARQRALATPLPTDADGDWTAHVTVVNAGDVEGGDLVDEGPGEDEGTEWQLATEATSYALAIEDEGPADVREEVQTFELDPGEGMEHKVRLPANETLAYAWRASSEVYYDRHAEPANGSGFTSFGTGTSEEATGHHLAPFEGTHGWYWENQGDDPVAITLATRGNYTDGFTT